jgi:hypothetical protein
MGGTIDVRHDEVYTLVQTLIANMQNDIASEAQTRYSGIVESKERVDGATNASLIHAANLNLEKTAALCETLEKLLIYISDASQQLRAKDEEMSGQIAGGVANG